MQYRASSPVLTSMSEVPTVSTCSIVVTPSGLLAALASVPDPRRRQGVRFALSAIVALAVAAILSNHLSVLAIAEWCTSQSQELLRALGFPNGVTPHQSTIQRLFAKINPDHLPSGLRSVDVAKAPPNEPSLQLRLSLAEYSVDLVTTLSRPDVEAKVEAFLAAETVERRRRIPAQEGRGKVRS